MKTFVISLAASFCLLPAMAVESASPINPQDTVVVRRWDVAGARLAEAKAEPKVRKSGEAWRKQLTPEQYRVTRHADTEHPFCGKFYDHKQAGRYDCVGCALPLFRSDAKFDSGTGWPSFFQPITAENVSVRVDRSHGMVREEILCTRCEAHLGHVFSDGPKPTGRRYCLNSASMTFVPDAPAGQTGGKTRSGD